MAITPSWRIAQASATCAGVAPIAVATLARVRSAREPSLFDRAVRHGRGAMLCKPGQQVVFGTPPREIVEDLVGHAGAPVCCDKLFHVVAIKVADAPVPDLALGLQGFHRFDGLAERHRPAPVEQVQVEPVGAEPLQAGLAGTAETFARGILRIGLADQEQLVTHVAERLADEGFGRAVAIHLGRIDERHAEFDSRAQRRSLGGAALVSLAHHPGALAERRHRLSAWEHHSLHVGLTAGMADGLTPDRSFRCNDRLQSRTRRGVA